MDAAALTVTPGSTSLPPISRTSCVTPATRGRTRSTSRASSACVAASWTSIRPAPSVRSGSSSSATRSSRSAPTTRRRSGRRAPSIRRRSCRSRELPGDPDERRIGPRRSSTTSRWRAGRRFRIRAGRGRGARAQGVRAGPRRLRRCARARTAGAPQPDALIVDWEDVEERLATGTALETLALGEEEEAHAHRVAAGARIRRPRCRTGSPRSSGAGARRDDDVRRPHARGAPSGRSSCSPTTRSLPCRSSAPRTRTRVGAGRRRPADARVPAAGRQRCSSGPRPTSSRKSGRSTSAAGPRPRTFLSDFRDLKVGDLVVHVDHGIGVFVGLKRIDVGLEPQEFMELRYAGEDKLFVPVERLDLVQKYTGASRPALDRLGGTTVGEGQDARQEGDARHGRGAAEALRRAQGGAGSRLQPGLALAAGVRGRLRVGPDASISGTRSPTSRATWSRRRRWIACCAATSATARPRSRCARRSRR